MPTVSKAKAASRQNIKEDILYLTSTKSVSALRLFGFSWQKAGLAFTPVLSFTISIVNFSAESIFSRINEFLFRRFSELVKINVYSMVLILDGISQHVAHAWRKIGLIRDCALRAHLLMSYHITWFGVTLLAYKKNHAKTVSMILL